MNYCPNCGNEVNKEQDVCLNCGKALKNIPTANDDGGAIWLVVGLFVPVVGLILYLIWKDERPLSANKAGKGALISVMIGVGFAILMTIIFVIAATAAFA